MNLNDLREKRGRLVNQMRAMLETAEADDRDLNAEEQIQYDALEAEQDGIADRIRRQEGLDSISAAIAQPQSTPIQMRPESGRPLNAVGTPEYRNAFDRWARVGGAIDEPGIRAALQVGTDSEGGYIVPEEYETRLVEEIQDINEFRQWVDTFTTSGDRNIPVESTLGTATWTAEEAAYTESDAAFGQVVIGAHKLGTIIKVSEELLQDSFFDLGGYLARNFGKRFGLAEEAAIVNGDGSGKPTGLVQGASGGITAASATAITSDEVIDLYHALTRPYRRNARWVMKDSTVKLVRKLKDSDNQYLWQPGLQGDEPDRILGRPLAPSDAMPAATTGNVSVLFGDLSYYALGDRTGRVIQRLNELYAANGQIGFRGFERLDGALTLSAAVKKLTQA